MYLFSQTYYLLGRLSPHVSTVASWRRPDARMTTGGGVWTVGTTWSRVHLCAASGWGMKWRYRGQNAPRSFFPQTICCKSTFLQPNTAGYLYSTLPLAEKWDIARGTAQCRVKPVQGTSPSSLDADNMNQEALGDIQNQQLCSDTSIKMPEPCLQYQGKREQTSCSNPRITKVRYKYDQKSSLLPGYLRRLNQSISFTWIIWQGMWIRVDTRWQLGPWKWKCFQPVYSYWDV